MLIYIIKKCFSFLLILFLLSVISFSLIYYFADISVYQQQSFVNGYYNFYSQLLSNQPELANYLKYTPLSILQQVLLPTFELGFIVIICAIIIGVPVGIIAGLTHSRGISHFINLLCLIFYACPIVWMAVLISSSFFLNWDYFKDAYELSITANTTIINILFSDEKIDYQALIIHLKYLSLPVVILAIQPCIVTIQLIGQQVTVTSQQNFIKVARIREDSSTKVLFRHLLPNAVPATIPQFIYNITTLLFSIIVIEILLNRSGLGMWVFNALEESNYFVIAIALLSCGTVVGLLTLLSQIFIALMYPIQARDLHE